MTDGKHDVPMLLRSDNVAGVSPESLAFAIGEAEIETLLAACRLASRNANRQVAR